MSCAATLEGIASTVKSRMMPAKETASACLPGIRPFFTASAIPALPLRGLLARLAIRRRGRQIGARPLQFHTAGNHCRGNVGRRSSRGPARAHGQTVLQYEIHGSLNGNPHDVQALVDPPVAVEFLDFRFAITSQLLMGRRLKAGAWRKLARPRKRPGWNAHGLR